MNRTARAWAGLVGMAAFAAAASADVTIIGALSNFDVPNSTPEVCDEFEFELEGPHPEDCYGTWGNWNYGPGVVTSNAAGTGIKVVYRRVGHSTNVGAIEHFGVHLRNFNLITGRVFRWKHNGVVVAQGPGMVPIPQTTIRPTPTVPELVEVVENEEPEDSIWVRRSVIGIGREVALGELMSNNALILGATPLEVDMERLGPGETLEALDPIEEDGVASVVIVIETFEDVPTWNAATQEFDHAPGDMLSRVMNATVIESTPCTATAEVTLQPADVTAHLDGRAEFTVAAVEPAAGGEAFYQWRKDGVPIPDEDNTTLSIDPVTEADAGAYTCVITNDCGSVSTIAAYLTVPYCAADFNHENGKTVQDIYDFLTEWNDQAGMTGSGLMSDFNGSGSVTVQDLYDFLTAWMGTCA